MMAKSHDRPRPDALCDGGDLDCGSGLLLIIREAMMPLSSGQTLEVQSRERSVAEDLPAWCRMVGHGFDQSVAHDDGRTTSYFIKKRADEREREQLDADLERAARHEWRVRVRVGESESAGVQARVYARNHALTIGQPASFDTEDAAPSALEALLAALGSCIGVGLVWRLSRQGATVRDLELTLKARSGDILTFLGLEERQSQNARAALLQPGNPGLAEIQGTAYVQGDISPELLARTLEETIRRSPVARSLSATCKLAIDAKLVG